MALYRIWRGVLLQPDIGIRDNFFDLGGTSISAIKLAYAVRRKFGHRLPVREVMVHPTIEALAGRLRGSAAVRQSAARQPDRVPGGAGRPAGGVRASGRRHRVLLPVAGQAVLPATYGVLRDPVARE